VLADKADLVSEWTSRATLLAIRMFSYPHHPGSAGRGRHPKPPRTFLEMDELVAVIEAAEAHDQSPTVVVPIGDSTRDRVA
jgi:hypothetical protein